MYSQFLEEFHGQSVVDFEGADSWKGPGFVYRLRQEYDSENTLEDRLATLVGLPDASRLTGLIIGAWGSAYEGGESNEIVAALAGHAAKLPALEALFFGEMTYDECELSWINQGDVAPLLNAFPKLEIFHIRGSNGLSFTKTRHAALKHLRIESGGLPSKTIRELFQCDFPSLERLELLLGEDNYGFDGSVEDLQPLMSGKLFPHLKHLGLMNSEIANDVAAVIVNSPIVERLESLDLSMGNIDGEGIKSLHALASRTNLLALDVSHHYASPEQIAELEKALPFTVIAEPSDEGDEDDEWRPILHAE